MQYSLKIVVFSVVVSIWGFSFSQSKMPDIKSFNPYIEMPFSFQDTIVLHVGEKTLFSQLCRDDIPKDISTLSLGFEKLLINGKAYRSIVYFKDTLITKAIYYFEGVNKSSGFQLFGLCKNEFTKIKRKHYHYTRMSDNVLINCWYDRKSFFYQEELIKIE